MNDQMPTSLMMEESYSSDNGIEVLSRRARRVLWLVVRDGRRVVLKGLTEELKSHPEEVAALRKEYLLGLRLENPRTVRVYGFEQHPLLGPVIAMEYVDGIPLNQYLHGGGERAAQAGVSPKLSERRRIAFETAEALAAVHRAGVAHRDLKPDNILISSKDATPKIIDFGNGDAEDFVIYKHSLGTERYGAPEQMEPSQGGMASDVYSFGKILDELLPERQFKGIRKACQAEEASLRPDMETVARRLNPTRAAKKRMAVVASGAILLIIMGVALWIGTKQTVSDPKITVPETIAHTPADAPAVATDSVKEMPVSSKEEIGRPESTSPASPPVVTEEKRVVKTVVVEENGSVSEIIKKYIQAADKINARYGKIPYDGEKESGEMRLRRGNEHFKLADKMENELEGLGLDKAQRAQANHELWTHIIFETNRIDGADEIARQYMEKNYSSPAATE